MWCLCLAAVPFLAAAPAAGIVLHNDAYAPTDKPNDAVVGRWSTNGSAVAIGLSGWTGSEYIITTRHQAGGVGSTVWFGGKQYTVVAVTNHPSADLRVVRIRAVSGTYANLTNFVQCYADDDEVSEHITLGGFGKSRGSEIKSGQTVIGYNWAGTDNTTERWGTNRIDDGGTAGGTYTSYVLIADFDAPTSKDAAVAEWDSGGGWFIKDISDGTWYVAGLSRGVGHSGQSYFIPPDYMDAVRVSSYPWINSCLGAQPIQGDANLDHLVDSQDFTILKANFGVSPSDWGMGDFNNDGLVDGQDFTFLKNNFGKVWSDGGGEVGVLIPEPATVSLFSIAGIAILLARGKRK
jgi:hypothetical protein